MIFAELRAGGDFLDFEHREFLPMPAFAAVILASLLLEHDYFRAARLLEDFRPDRRACDNRRADLGRFAADCQNLVERYRRANLAAKPLDRNLVADPDAVLLSACPNDCKHDVPERV